MKNHMIFIYFPGLLGQAPPPMMGARMPVAGQMIIPGQEEAMPVTTMAGLGWVFFLPFKIGVNIT